MEQLIIGTIIECEGRNIPSNIARLLEYAPASFDDHACQEISSIIKALLREKLPVHSVAIAKRLDLPDAYAVVATIVNQAAALSVAEDEAALLWDAFMLRQVGDAMREAAQQSKERPDDAHLIAKNLLKSISGLGSSRSGLPAIVAADSFVASPTQEPPQLIHGMLHQGSKLVLGGGSKSFKTWALLDLAISVATGDPWMNFTTTKGRVLYINFEIQDYAWSKRIDLVSRAKGLADVPGLSLWNLRGYGADFATLLPKVVEECKSKHFSLIVVDPIYKLYGDMDENKAGDVAQLLNGLERVSVETGAGIAFGAHFSKGNQSQKEAIDRVSGSGVFARDPDSILMLTKHEEDDCFTVDSILRNFAPVEPFVVRWEFPLFRTAGTLDPTLLKQTGGAPRKHTVTEILSYIEFTTRDNPISMSAWADTSGIPRPTLIRYTQDMRAKQLVETIGEGQAARQFITTKGLAIIKGT